MFLFKLVSTRYILTAICVLFLITRLYKISEIPVSVYWDEASIGYNAYSIAQTGRDEWGKFLPIHFRAFGEFKLPVYIYAAAISAKIFGLNEFAVRIPAVLFSLGVVILTYFLAKKLSGNVGVGLLSGFFISVSPWFFIFSRTGYEATAGLFFYLLAIYFFLNINKNTWLILFSVLGFILSAYSYNSFRIISPLTILVLIIYEFKNIKSILPIIVSVIFIILSLIPVYRLYKYDSGMSRFQAVSTTSGAFIKNYLSHFSPDFLILRGDKNLRSQQTGFGQIYLPELILFPLGLIYMVKRKSKYNFLLLLLLFLGPIPAAITKESPHALRSISMVPFICLISGSGVFFIKRYLKLKYLTEAIVLIVFLLFFMNYYENFLSVYGTASSEDWQYGYKKIYSDYKDQFVKYDRILISDEYAQPYIFVLFYQGIDPNEFRKTVARNSVDHWGFSTVSSFDKFEFGKVDKLSNLKSGRSLIFADKERTSNLAPLGMVKFLDGKTAFWIYEHD